MTTKSHAETKQKAEFYNAIDKCNKEIENLEKTTSLLNKYIEISKILISENIPLPNNDGDKKCAIDNNEFNIDDKNFEINDLMSKSSISKIEIQIGINGIDTFKICFKYPFNLKSLKG